ncbi:TPA: restriction endonuclease [Pseudomonas aeruginosa]|uniref:restriction endonuclease n=1 Tax=Pseudomonas aeruginosa TaxID=287 RepID=UPI0027EE9288|nr:restriction endonuclease [Pseudomonas aeruginosa]ELJ2278756.1 restriction endonuclease [Pseudomonas aeruginosa]
MLIDFSEILDSTDWEEFSKAFLDLSGYRIDIRPGVGPDGGKDIIASQDVGNRGVHRWLVSCKYHRAGTIGVGVDEANANKLFEHKCHSFLFVYSRPPTQALIDSFERVSANANATYYIFSNREIEQVLVSHPTYYILIRQYFPRSYERLVRDLERLECECEHTVGNVYLIPYEDTKTRQVTQWCCCDYCVSYKISSLQEAGINFGTPVMIHPEEDID